MSISSNTRVSNLPSFPFELLILFIEVYVLLIDEHIQSVFLSIVNHLIKLEKENIVQKQVKYSRLVNLFQREESNVDNERYSVDNIRSMPRECIGHRVNNREQH